MKVEELQRSKIRQQELKNAEKKNGVNFIERSKQGGMGAFVKKYAASSASSKRLARIKAKRARNDEAPSSEAPA